MTAISSLPPSIEAYRPAAERIWSWLEAGWLHQKRFDDLAWSELRDNGPISSLGTSGASIMLPSIMGRHTEDHLAILQEMMRGGLVVAREGADGKIEYARAA